MMLAIAGIPQTMSGLGRLVSNGMAKTLLALNGSALRHYEPNQRWPRRWIMVAPRPRPNPTQGVVVYRFRSEYVNKIREFCYRLFQNVISVLTVRIPQTHTDRMAI